jgi:hypothetical protein
MRMNTCPFPRMQSFRIGFVLLAASLSLSGQTARIHSNGTQANLRIDVKVVPAVAVHHRDKDKDDDRDKDQHKGQKDDAVFYNLNPQHEELSVTEETRLMMVDSGNSIHQEQVRAITIVPK